ncbi:FAD-dependent oxidoreductase [Rhodococcus sp. T2V]|uniref:NAD(P)/FAD-dependent oxidoreductase n=1 Tax=Rhodococcus sp. T2V TaxID=3034164 RepID=UPI0023E0FD92|nr:FAD-dependent oxidoreductase [Rhodococcus sp. T2V]MDF3309552.1 FAD-dependent oxidoreductase [Rhodococcus sp. T2V]
MSETPRVVIVGAGHTGAQAAIALRAEGFEGHIVLTGDEEAPPYNRPPLSKSFLKSTSDAVSVAVRPEGFWAEQDITLQLGRRSVAIDRTARKIALDDGSELDFDRLVLAMGSRPRTIPTAPGIATLRTIKDALRVRNVLRPGARVILVGAGYIGLEVAAAACEAGAEVSVIEAAPDILRRTLSGATARYLQTAHERAGARFLLGSAPRTIRPTGVEMGLSENVEGDVVILGIGVQPNVELAEDAGLAVLDGVVVDEHLRTSDPNIFAIGDCARFPCAVTGRPVRLESVQNGTDQARHVARTLAGEDTAPYRSVPYFWTEQHGHKVMIAGVSAPDDDVQVRGNLEDDSFSVFRHDAEGRLTAVESVNAPHDHVAARRTLGGRT